MVHWPEQLRVVVSPVLPIVSPRRPAGQGENEVDDKAFCNAFMATADETPEFDVDKAKQRRRVIGQIIDNESMKFLSRLSSLPINQKGGGIGVGGKKEGPPLLKVTIRDIGVRKVQEQEDNATQQKGKKKMNILPAMPRKKSSARPSRPAA